MKTLLILYKTVANKINYVIAIVLLVRFIYEYSLFVIGFDFLRPDNYLYRLYAFHFIVSVWPLLCGIVFVFSPKYGRMLLIPVYSIIALVWILAYMAGIFINIKVIYALDLFSLHTIAMYPLYYICVLLLCIRYDVVANWAREYMLSHDLERQSD